MSYPYLTDLLNALLGTDLHLPIPTFGAVVMIAIVAATIVVRRGIRADAHVLEEILAALPRDDGRAARERRAYADHLSDAEARRDSRGGRIIAAWPLKLAEERMTTIPVAEAFER